MNERITLSLIADARQVIPTVATWFEKEWAPYYGPEGPGNATADLVSWCNSDRVPFAMVARSAEGEPLGVAALKRDGLDSGSELGPWLSALFVRESFRRQGVGSLLISGIVAKARELEIEKIYVATDADPSLFIKNGWVDEKTKLQSLRGMVRIFSISTKWHSAGG